MKYQFLKGELLLQEWRLFQTVPHINLLPLLSVAYHLENKLVIIIIIIIIMNNSWTMHEQVMNKS